MKFLFTSIIFLSSIVYSDTLKVAVYNFPPCVILDDSKKPVGFDIDVFNAITEKSGIKVQYVIPDKFSDLIDGVANGIYDAAISGITITGDRENRVDFTHPYLNSGLMICLKKGSKVNVFRTIFRYFNNIKPMLMLVCLFTLLCAVLIFFVEKIFSKDKSMFSPDKPAEGIMDGYYFSNIFTSTVGFGDFVPKSFPGKFLTVAMVVAGVYIIIPYANANMNMSLQQEQSNYSISSIDDLTGKVVATEEETTSEALLKRIGCNVKTTKVIDDAYTLLGDNKVDAVVFDMPTIKYFVEGKGKGKFCISGNVFDRQPYGFALRKNSPYRKVLNENLVDFMRTETYWELHKKWFGDN